MVERLCALADLPKPRVAIIPTDVPNAFATGRNPKHAAVAVTQGLWQRLEPQEVEAVLAHELSHVANRDVLIMTLASFFAMLAAFLTRCRPLRRHVRRLRRRRRPARLERQQRRADLADHLRRLGRHLRDQLRPHPHDLALPRVRGRPRLGADDRRAGEPDERAAEDLERDHADPAAGPPRGRGDERLLHHLDELARAGRRALHGSPAAREAARRPRGDLPRDGQARRLRSRSARRTSRTTSSGRARRAAPSRAAPSAAARAGCRAPASRRSGRTARTSRS